MGKIEKRRRGGGGGVVEMVEGDDDEGLRRGHGEKNEIKREREARKGLSSEEKGSEEGR